MLPVLSTPQNDGVLCLSSAEVIGWHPWNTMPPDASHVKHTEGTKVKKWGQEAGMQCGHSLSFHFFPRPKACSKFLLWSLPLLHPPDCSGLRETQESQQHGWRRWRNLSGVVHDMTELLGCDGVDVQWWVWMDGTRFRGAGDTGREELAKYDSTVTRSSREQEGVSSTVPELRTI